MRGISSINPEYQSNPEASARNSARVSVMQNFLAGFDGFNRGAKYTDSLIEQAEDRIELIDSRGVTHFLYISGAVELYDEEFPENEKSDDYDDPTSQSGLAVGTLNSENTGHDEIWDVQKAVYDKLKNLRKAKGIDVRMPLPESTDLTKKWADWFEAIEVNGITDLTDAVNICPFIFERDIRKIRQNIVNLKQSAKLTPNGSYYKHCYEHTIKYTLVNLPDICQRDIVESILMGEDIDPKYLEKRFREAREELSLVVSRPKDQAYMDVMCDSEKFRDLIERYDVCLKMCDFFDFPPQRKLAMVLMFPPSKVEQFEKCLEYDEENDSPPMPEIPNPDKNTSFDTYNPALSFSRN